MTTAPPTIEDRIAARVNRFLEDLRELNVDVPTACRVVVRAAAELAVVGGLSRTVFLWEAGTAFSSRRSRRRAQPYRKGPAS